MAASEQLRVVDAHHHLWDLDAVRFSWLNGPNKVDVHIAGKLDPIRKNYLVKDYLHDARNQNLVKSVLVQAEADDALEEARWAQSVADSNAAGFPHAIVAQAHLQMPELEAYLQRLVQFKNVRGVRHLLNWHDTEPRLRQADHGNYLKDPRWAEGFGLLRKYGLSYDLHCLPHQGHEFMDVLKRHPEVPVVVNHTGIDPHRTPESFARWETAVRQYASFPGTHIKISGLGMFDHHFTVASTRPYILTAISVFGVDRCMFGSNFPVDKLLSDYDTLYNTFKEVVRDFPLAEKQKLFQLNAERFYRI